MPQPCTICTHTSRPEIDRLIVSGEPNQRVATKFGVTESAIRRHRASHLPQALAKAQAAKEVARAGYKTKLILLRLDALRESCPLPSPAKMNLKLIEDVRGGAAAINDRVGRVICPRKTFSQAIDNRKP